MQNQTGYKALLITENTNSNLHTKHQELSKRLDFSSSIVYSTLEALEFLMDTNVDLILIDLTLGKDEALSFLEHISDDYENKLTPIILITDPKNCDHLIHDFVEFNVLSIVPQLDWDLHIEKLIYFLKVQKLNLDFIQNSLMESEDRGTVDQLTGAYNRYGCEDIFHSLTARVKAYQEPFCVVMLDVDHFKKINDTYGHDVGDEVLVSFADSIMNSIRKNDSLVRLGGEEFILFLANVNIHIGQKIAENLRVKFESNLISSKNINITSSLGVVQYQHDENFDSIIKRVDELVYKAKASGRNIVMVEESINS